MANAASVLRRAADRAPLEPTPSSWADLSKAFLDADGFEAWTAEKLCGGFHPDWAVVWTTPEGPLEVLVCFGCDEVKVFSPRGRLRLDFGKEKRAALLSAFDRVRGPAK